MNRAKRWLIIVSLLFGVALSAEAQKSKPAPKPKSTVTTKPATKPKPPPVAKPVSKVKADPTPTFDPASQEAKVRDIVVFLEFMLNTLGSSSTSTYDKDVVITESYTKIFRDGKVQIEDDLDENRGVITNKDVPAYLKDVDFFFKDAKFEFTIESIKQEGVAGDNLFYKVSLTRNLSGTTADGKTVNNAMPRFIEVNYNPKDQDLRIVSIYTNEFDEKRALTNWWYQLSFEWQSVFKRKLASRPAREGPLDSLQLTDIKAITALEALDIGNNLYIQNLEPLSQLVNLKSLNISNTTITDLNPLRNLTELKELDLSGTPVKDLSALRYATQLIKLKMSRSLITGITVIQKMPGLQYLDMRATMVSDFEPIKNLKELRYLNLSATRVADLSPISPHINLAELNLSETPISDLGPVAGLKNITVLRLDSSRVEDLTALAKLENLDVLYANHTSISSLRPLQDLKHLEKIYCDHTRITRTQADAFKAARPEVLVIFDSEDLKTWWDALPAEWRSVFSDIAKIGPNPTKEELSKIPHLDSINCAERSSIQDLEPLRRLQQLQVVIVNKTAIGDLSPLKELKEIRFIDIRDTPVSNLSPVNQFTKLKILVADNTRIGDIDALSGTTSLKKLYVDKTAVNDFHVQEFLKKNPDCLVVFKTGQLENWWSQLSENWKGAFQVLVPMQAKAGKEDLHKLVELEAVHIKDVEVVDPGCLKIFVRLKEFHFSGTTITDLSSIASIKSLISLHATNSPIRTIESISPLVNLEDLDISNTSVEDLGPLYNLQNLKKLNCSGTQVRKLTILEKLQSVEYIDCSNTSVSRLDPIFALPLKTLKCYNTSVSTRAIEKFKQIKPDCNVIYYR